MNLNSMTEAPVGLPAALSDYEVRCPTPHPSSASEGVLGTARRLEAAGFGSVVRIAVNSPTYLCLFFDTRVVQHEYVIIHGRLAELVNDPTVANGYAKFTIRKEG
jgi:hypothetical protein